MLVIESLVQNKQKKRMLDQFKTQISLQIITMMAFYWIIGNILLFSLFDVFTNPWKIIIGFTCGFLGSLFGFIILSWSSKWLLSRVPIKQACAYFTFLLRMLIYGGIVGLAIAFNFANLISIIAGLSLIMIAAISNELIVTFKTKKEKKDGNCIRVI